MATRATEPKAKKEAMREPKPKEAKPALKDLDADPNKADKVRGGPATCRVPAGC